MNLNVLCAVFRRNFVSYFTNATGYVFICVFVLLSSFAAFWPDEFFNANLANLDQLNIYFPYIMLIFIPSITMSTWAEERREGTDELLLTIPAKDTDLVLGKYFAAVAIVTVSLLFSMATNWIVLGELGSPDWGQMAATYIGYWLVGLAMLAIGQVASFLTKNLTVAYVLGALFNAPLVFAPFADSFLPEPFASGISLWGIEVRFADFGNGVISFGGVAYFVIIAVVMVYLCIVLVGHRRWVHSWMVLHYPIRVFSLSLIGVCLCVLFQLNDFHWDLTEAQLSSLSPKTKELLTDLEKSDRVVQIEAFVSPKVPEKYVQIRRNLLNTLRELEVYGGGKIRVKINSTEKSSDESTRAQQQYGIVPRQVTFSEHGAITADQIFLGVAVRSGLNRVTIPFLGEGDPVEYELIRSVCTVLEEKRRKIGVLMTDAPLYGRFDMQRMAMGQNWQLIDELEKQYDVVQVDASKPIDPKSIDALLAVQPSSLGPVQMENFIAAIEQGIPTAIFEDPAPLVTPGIPGTGDKRLPPGGGMNMLMRQQSPPKGDITKLWKLLGIDFPAQTVIWQEFNPYDKVSYFDELKEYVFLDKALDEKSSDEKSPKDKSPEEKKVFGSSPISSGFQQIVLQFPGAFRKENVSVLEVEPLAATGAETTGTIQLDLLRGSHGFDDLAEHRHETDDVYIMAAHITGTQPAKEPEKPKSTKIDVVLVADVDMISPGFFDMVHLKDALSEFGYDLNFQFDNVAFVLNILDTLAGDDRFLEIRKRRRSHPVLTKIDKDTEEARKETTKMLKELKKQRDEQIAASNEKFARQFNELKQKMQSGGTDIQAFGTQLAIMQQSWQKRQKAVEESLQREYEQQKEKIDRELANKIRSVQNWYKRGAVLLPPILPLMLAMIVFCIRRIQEHQGAVRGRMKK